MLLVFVSPRFFSSDIFRFFYHSRLSQLLSTQVLSFLLCNLTLSLLTKYLLECSYAIESGLTLPANSSCATETIVGSAGVALQKILPPILVTCAVVVLAAFCLWRRLRGRNAHLSELLLSTEQEMEVTQHQLAALRKVWEIDWAEIHCTDCIGKGAMGKVWQGKWRGMDVAVKVLTGSFVSVEELREEMDREATMLQTLRHAHVVQFLGAGTTSERGPFLVTELMELGSLTGLLYGDRNSDNNASARIASFRVKPTDWTTKWRFAKEIASGMDLVHSLGRMHRDLKSGNVLATCPQGRVVLKVADFGTMTLAENWHQVQSQSSALSTSVHAHLHGARFRTQLTMGIGTPLWMAPEIFEGQRYGPSADVFSYAIVLWEIAAQSEPWPDADGAFLGQQLFERIEAGQRPELDEQAWPADFIALMKQCWTRDPAARPTFRQILSDLNRDSR